MTLYNFISDIEPQQWLEYLVVLVFVMFVVTRIIQPTSLQLIAFVIALFVIYYRMDKRSSTISTAYDELEYRLKTLHPKPENFQMDADLINIFYNMREFRKYHSDGYDQSLVAVDNMLKLVSEVEAGVYHCKDNLDIIKDQMNKALNHFHAILYKLPDQIYFMRKHKRALNALHVILRRHVDDVSRKCKEFYDKRPMDIDYHPIYNSGPRPDDSQNEERSNFDFYY